MGSISLWRGKKYLHCNSLGAVGHDKMGCAVGMALVQKPGVHSKNREADRELISLSDLEGTWKSAVLSGLV